MVPSSLSPSRLEEVVQLFSQWRSRKKTRLEPTPLALCRAAAGLVSHYPRGRILRSLGISAEALQSFEAKSQDQKGDMKDPLFVPLSLIGPDQEEHHRCEIKKPGGIHLVIQTRDVAAVIQAFLCSA